MNQLEQHLKQLEAAEQLAADFEAGDCPACGKPVWTHGHVHDEIICERPTMMPPALGAPYATDHDYHAHDTDCDPYAALVGGIDTGKGPPAV